MIGHDVSGNVIRHVVPRTESLEEIAALSVGRQKAVHGLVRWHEHATHIRFITGLVGVSPLGLVQIPSGIEIKQTRCIRTVELRKSIRRTLIEITGLENRIAILVTFIEHRTSETVHQTVETTHISVGTDIGCHVLGRNQYILQLMQVAVLAYDVLLDNLVGKQ